MCGRYALHAHPDVVALQFGLGSVPDFRRSYNIAPATQALIVEPKGASIAHWGLRGKFVNLRAETVQTKFRTSGRCLVPASGFYEWKSEGRRKQPYYFRSASEPLLALAGVWERDTCSLITTEPNAVVGKVHDRMPLIVPRERYAAWLGGNTDLLEDPPEVRLTGHPVSMAVNQAANDAPALIAPAALAPDLFD